MGWRQLLGQPPTGKIADQLAEPRQDTEAVGRQAHRERHADDAKRPLTGRAS
jgi:hypothetical protein